MYRLCSSLPPCTPDFTEEPQLLLAVEALQSVHTVLLQRVRFEEDPRQQDPHCLSRLMALNVRRVALGSCGQLARVHHAAELQQRSE